MGRVLGVSSRTPPWTERPRVLDTLEKYTSLPPIHSNKNASDENRLHSRPALLSGNAPPTALLRNARRDDNVLGDHHILGISREGVNVQDDSY